MIRIYLRILTICFACLVGFDRQALAEQSGGLDTPPNINCLPLGARGVTILDLCSNDGVTGSIQFQQPVTGFLGIGLPVAANPLDVNGSVAIGTYAGTTVGGSNELVVSGAVGFGTSTPVGVFDIHETSVLAPAIIEGAIPRLALVDTSVAPNSVSQSPSWFIDNFQDNFRIFRQPNLATGGFAPITITNVGNVGIMTTPQTTLDVNGGIRAGSFTIGNGCSPEGTLGYDPSAHTPIYCNVSGVWAKVGGGHPTQTEALQSGNNTGLSTLTSVKPHDLCVVNAFGIWDGGHLYSGDFVIFQNADRTWTASAQSSSYNNLDMTCYDFQ